MLTLDVSGSTQTTKNNLFGDNCQNHPNIWTIERKIESGENEPVDMSMHWYYYWPSTVRVHFCRPFWRKQINSV